MPDFLGKCFTVLIFKYFFFSFAVFCLYISCSSSSSNSENELDQFEKTFGRISKCSENPGCKSDCRRLFIKDSSLVERCSSRSITDVRYMKKIVLAMERGQWSSIQASELEVVFEFNRDLWLDHAAISKNSSREMLVWVAEEEEIAELLDDDGRVLKTAFKEVGSSYGDNSVIEGMKDRVDLTDNRNFFEIAAVNDNNDAFKNAHNLLKKECDEERVCIKQVYCSSCADIIFGRLNELDLGEDADSDGLLHKTECPKCQ